MKIKAIITGSTGMVGKGVLLECLESPEVESVLVLNRRPVRLKHERLKELIHADFLDLSAIRKDLEGYNACFFCLGVSSAGMPEEKYRTITYDLTLNFARTVLELNPGMDFVYVSGEGTDSNEKSRMAWARIKGKTENDLLAMPFRSVYMFRPGFIQPMKGIKSRTRLYRILYIIFTPLYYLLKPFPKLVTNTEKVGRAMIRVVRDGYEKRVLGNSDINRLSGSNAVS
jgi:uncharacterized protein YbjT (DUF2867 family)